MSRGKKTVERVTELMKDPKHIRNIGIVAHIDHGKTTLSDNLLSGAGIISEELAGKQLFMDSDPEEQARGITIDASNVSMVHEYDGQDYLINMIDTPGHVDFGGDVTRAMRAVDGAVVLVEAIANCGPREETVRLKYGGINVPKSVDTAPLRRVDSAIGFLAEATLKASRKSKKPASAILADELIAASKGDAKCFSVGKKEERERIAKSAR